MLTAGDLVETDLGVPEGREAGFRRPAVVVTAQRVLDAEPSVVHVVPVTSAIRRYASEVVLESDEVAVLPSRSTAQCHQVGAVAAGRVTEVVGNVGPVVLRRIRGIVGDLLDISA